MSDQSGLRALQKALPTWVRLERHQGAPVLSEHTEGGVHVTEVMGFPEAPPGSVRADVHFALVAPTEGLPDKDVFISTVAAALGQGEFETLDAEDLAGGPSYILLGAWLGSQDFALMLIGAAELFGVSHAITPKMLGMNGSLADNLAGAGMVMLGPSPEWVVVR